MPPTILEAPCDPPYRLFILRSAGDPVPECVVTDLGVRAGVCTCDRGGCRHVGAVRLAVAMREAA
jgi:hypothetical protein